MTDRVSPGDGPGAPRVSHVPRPRSRPALASLALAAAGLALLAPAASAKKPEPPRELAKDPPPAEANAEQSFWGRVAHPNQERYAELTAQGRALLDQEKTANAVEVLTEAARLDPARPEAWWFLGMAFKRLDRFAECADALDRVVARKPEGWMPDGVRSPYPEPAFSLALCDAAAGRLDAAVVLLERALETDGLTAEATATLTYNLADSYHALGRLEDAIRAYQQAIEIRSLTLYHFSLAVALDRDDQGARAREEMTLAVASDQTLAAISHPGTLFVPVEDEDYFRGFALEILATTDIPKRACQPTLVCRPLARVYFRRYLERAPNGPWRARAEAHLHDLGDAAPRAADEVQVDVRAGSNVATVTYAKLVLGAVPRLHACVAGKPFALYRVDVVLPGKAAPPVPKPVAAPPPPGAKAPKPPKVITPNVPAKRPPGTGLGNPAEKTFTVVNASPVLTEDAARACVVDVVSGLKWPGPAASPVRIQFAVSTP